MALENGEWILHGADWDSPDRIRSWQELIEYVDAVGFLPLFKNEVEGFSVEEKTSPLFWWTGDPKQDPWEWRAIIARSEKVAYGKFFNKKAGFISLRWFPYFANYRRDGYDFDARWEDGLSGYRSKKLPPVGDEFPKKSKLRRRHLAELTIHCGSGPQKVYIEKAIVVDLPRLLLLPFQNHANLF